MRRTVAGLALVLSLILPVTGAHAAQETTARAAFVVDATTGAVLLDKDARTRIPTASMSKVMTMAVVFKALREGRLRLADELTVSEKAWKMEGSKMFVEVGKKVPVEDLIKGVIVQSGNDATVVLAEGVEGSEELFAGKMNELAQSYGMKDSHFMNASGMPDPKHYSTPRDLALLAWHLITEYPEEYKYYSMREFSWNNITQPNRNPLLGKVDGADGVKTGHTEEAGYCLIGSAVRHGRRVIMVIAGLPSAKDREAEGVRLMDWALNSFKLARLVTKGQVLATAPVVYGTGKTVKLLSGGDALSTVPANLDMKDISIKVRYMSPLIAPVKAGDKVGTLVVSGPEIGAQEFPLVAGADVDKKGFVALTFEKIIQAAKNK